MDPVPSTQRGSATLYLFPVLGVRMRYITPSFQSYEWGSKDFIQKLLNIPKTEILAEAWYGAHPKAPSTIDGVSLEVLLQDDPSYWLGPRLTSLPYLMKILAAEQALSIQVHPDAKQATEGFSRENREDIPIDSPLRNYRDPHHKPELILALTDFYALCGFRAYEEMRSIFLLYKIDSFFANFAAFNRNPDSQHFLDLYNEILSRQPLPELMEHILQLSPIKPYAQELIWARKLIEEHPTDRSVISPFIMNLVTLRPDQAMYLDAGIVHAYLHGAGIEIMTASDNVLRAGLTQKHIDVPELMKVLRPGPYSPKLITDTLLRDSWHRMPIAVRDFALWKIDLVHETALPKIDGAKIILCLRGNATLRSQNQSLPINRGESVIIPHSQSETTAIGKALLIMATVGSNS